MTCKTHPPPISTLCPLHSTDLHVHLCTRAKHAQKIRGHATLLGRPVPGKTKKESEGDKESRAAPLLVFGVLVGSGGDERTDGLRVAVPSSPVQGRPAILTPRDRAGRAKTCRYRVGGRMSRCRVRSRLLASLCASLTRPSCTYVQPSFGTTGVMLCDSLLA
jgi:hypothetical protein